MVQLICSNGRYLDSCSLTAIYEVKRIVSVCHCSTFARPMFILINELTFKHPTTLSWRKFFAVRFKIVLLLTYGTNKAEGCFAEIWSWAPGLCQ